MISLMDPKGRKEESPLARHSGGCQVIAKLLKLPILPALWDTGIWSLASGGKESSVTMDCMPSALYLLPHHCRTLT